MKNAGIRRYDLLKSFEIAATLLEILLYIINPLKLYTYSPEIMLSLFQASVLLAILNYNQNYVELNGFLPYTYHCFPI